MILKQVFYVDQAIPMFLIGVLRLIFKTRINYDLIEFYSHKVFSSSSIVSTMNISVHFWIGFSEMKRNMSGDYNFFPFNMFSAT